MTLPKAVAEAAAAAEAAQRALIDENNTPAEQASDTPSAEPVAQPEPETVPEVSEPEVPSESPEPGIDWQQRAEAAEQRYRVLQGKYNAEVKQAREHPSDDQSGQIAELQATVSQLQAQLQQAQSQPQQPAPELSNTSPDMDRLREDYGAEFVDDVSKLIEARAQQLVDVRVQDLGQNVSQLTHQQKVSQLTAELGRVGIDFNAVNADPLFLQWLAEADPMAGVPRQRLLDAAFGEQGDMGRTVHIFRQFVESKPTSNTPPPTVNPDRLATVKTTAPHQPAPQEVPAFDPNAYQRLCNMKALGRISDEEFARQEREMFAAQR